MRFVKRGDTQKGERQDCGTEKRTSSQHVHEIIPKEAISDCSGVSKFEALAVGPSALVFSLVKLNCDCAKSWNTRDLWYREVGGWLRLVTFCGSNFQLDFGRGG